MSDEPPADGVDADGDELPPPYRPWGSSGVPQPGADRPGAELPRVGEPGVSGPGAGNLGHPRGRVPPPPVPPEYPSQSAPPAGPQWYAPAAVPAPGSRPGPGTVLPGARPAPSAASRTGVDRRLLASVLALVAAATTWLPWFKTVGAGMFTLSDSRFSRVLNAWDLPARIIWSYRSPRGGPSLGWLVLGLAVGTLVLGFLGNARTAARLLAAVEALVAIMFLVQLGRIVDDSPAVGPIDIGVTDLAGIGVYVLLLVSLALLVVPRD